MSISGFNSDKNYCSGSLSDDEYESDPDFIQCSEEEQVSVKKRPRRNRKRPSRFSFETESSRQKRQRKAVERTVRTTPFSPSYTKELTSKLKGVERCPIFGRDKEVKHLAILLADEDFGIRPLLIGRPGVGKTSIVQKLAWQIANLRVHESLQNRSVVMFDCGTFIGTQLNPSERELIAVTFRGKMQKLYLRDPRTIFYFRRIDLLFKNELLKKYFQAIASENWSIIGSVNSVVESQRVISKGYRFKPCRVDEYDRQETVRIVGAKLANQMICGKPLVISEKNIRFAINLSEKHLSQLPCHVAAVNAIREAATYQLLVDDTLDRQTIEVDRAVLAETFSSYASRTAEELLYTGQEEMRALGEKFRSRVVGQDHAIQLLCEYVSDFKEELCDPDKPPGVFLFSGPTGVGKTELAKALADELYNDPSCFIRIDMSEYRDAESANRLIGSAPGFVGYEAGGPLIQAVLDKPNCVILIDEVEKGHPDVWNLFLQLFDDGRLTDGKGRTGDFTKAFFIMSTNLDRDGINSTMKKELVNRIDEIVDFNPLVKAVIKLVVEVHLQKLRDRYLTSQKYTLKWNRSVVRYLERLDYDPSLGMRNFCRNIEKELKPLLREIPSKGHNTEESSVVLEVRRGQLTAKRVDS